MNFSFFLEASCAGELSRFGFFDTSLTQGIPFHVEPIIGPSFPDKGPRIPDLIYAIINGFKSENEI